MQYILDFDSKHTITHYLDWLNQADCKFSFQSEKPWRNDPSLGVVLSLEESRNSLLSDFFCCGPLFIVSPKLKALLEPLSASLEFIPTCIMCGVNGSYEFYTLHIMAFLDAIDPEQSTIAGMKFNRYAGITNLVLDQTLIEGSDMFLLKNTLHLIVVISEKARNLFEANQIKGMKIQPLSKYEEDTYGI